MGVMRSTLLWASQNRRMEGVVRSSRLMRPLVSRFMPGEHRDDAVRAAQALASGGTPTIITFLGENVATDDDAEQTVGEYEQLFTALGAARLDAHVSIKLTQFGWDMDRGRALDRVRRVAALARAHATILAIDMESSAYVDSTVTAYETLLREYPDTALCLQAYLHRTPEDLRRLLPLRPYIRLVKGAYREPPDVALTRRRDIDARYRVLAGQLLDAVHNGSARVGFGTHDMRLVDAIRSDARQAGVADAPYEVQMLYGIQDAARAALAAAGLRTRVLISYGRAWYPWFMRRLAEKPANLLLIPRNLIS